jgi:hypothetical protein
MTTIHDAPLTNYPRLIATLIRQRTLKIVRRELQAQKQLARGFLHARASCVADVWLELLFSSTVDRERTHTRDDPDSSYTCHKPLHRLQRHLLPHRSMRAD